MSAARLRYASLWLCADLSALSPETLLRRVGAVLAGAQTHSAIAVWLRGASAVPARDAAAVCRAARELCDRHDTALIVGERADLAVLCGADGVHVTHRGPSAEDVWRYLQQLGASSMVLSGAAHDPAEVRALSPRCELLVASPFGEVAEKNPPLGVAGLSAMVACAPGRRFVALGRIDSPAAVFRAFSAGAVAVALRSPLLDEDPLARIAPIVEAVAIASDR